MSSRRRASTPKVTVKAMLCWSEYYNGKWQPAKTSDVNRPAASARTIPTARLDRSTASIAAASDASRTSARRTASSSSTSRTAQRSFLLYNTHSLPVRAMIRAPMGSRRTLRRTDDRVLIRSSDTLS